MIDEYGYFKKSYYDLAEGMAIDRQIAERKPCPKCAAKCNYDSLVRDGRYIAAFRICSNKECDYRIEF